MYYLYLKKIFISIKDIVQDDYNEYGTPIDCILLKKLKVVLIL